MIKKHETISMGKKPLLIICFIGVFLSIFVILSNWFSAKEIISTSEERFNFISPLRIDKKFNTSWIPAGFGYNFPLQIVYHPTLYVLSKFEIIGMSTKIIDFTLIGILMFVGVLNIYLLLSKGFKLPFGATIIGSVFYLLNLYTLAQVWKRFLYPNFFAWAYLPIFILIWLRWLKTTNLIWLIILAGTSIFFSVSFAHPAFLWTFWITAVVLTLTHIWKNKKQTKIIWKTTGSFLIALGIWSLFNFWWLIPFINFSSSYGTETFFDSNKNYLSLDGVSKYSSSWDIFLLRQSFYYGKDGLWTTFYSSPPVYILSIVIFSIAIYGCFKHKNYHVWLYLITMGFIGWWFSKGTTPPLGNLFFQWLFDTIPGSGALRNPYEKFGLVWLVSYTTFFSLGVYYLLNRYESKARLLVQFLIIIFSCVILVWPIWTGDILPKEKRINVPDYYRKANHILNLHSSNRIFHLPFLKTEHVKYTWGFEGEEPSFFLFDRESISRPYYLKPHDDIYFLIPKLIINKEFPKILGVLGIDQVIFHRDLISSKEDFDRNLDAIEKWQGIESEQQVGKLNIYTVDHNLVLPKVYAALPIFKNINIETHLTEILLNKFDYKQNVLLDERSLFNINFRSGILPTIDFIEKSFTSYEAHIKEAKGPFILVLNVNYHPSWTAAIDQKESNKHFRVNNFANGWLIEESGSYTVNMSFKTFPWD